MAQKQVKKTVSGVDTEGQKKNEPVRKVGTDNLKGAENTSVKGIKQPLSQVHFSIIVTGIFFIVVLFGLYHHEMWRDELQAWLVARDAHSIPELFKNMRYEGNPALWHLFLFLITCFTHDPVYMQALHLLIACGFIFVINRYSEIERPYKIMASFGYFTLFEYSVISRSYGLALLLIFIVCALYKNRGAHYLLIGIMLALLANVTIYGVIFSIGFSGILALDYLFFRRDSNKDPKKLLAALTIVVIGIAFSLYQIIPQKDNTFPVAYPKGFFDFSRWNTIWSRILTTYFYVPQTRGIHFWNTNFFYSGDINVAGWALKLPNTGIYWLLNSLSPICFIICLIIFLRKPIVLLLYAGITLALLSFYYYTDLLFLRYCGFLLVLLIVCYWLEKYYPEKEYSSPVLVYLSKFGKKMQSPFLVIVLAVNIFGAVVAYYKSDNNKFSVSKDVANYIRENKLDTLRIAGISDFVISPLTAYLDTQIFYPQMNDYGSFCIYNKKRNNYMSDQQFSNCILRLMNKDKTKILLVMSYPILLTNPDNGKQALDYNHPWITGDYKIEINNFFDAGIISDEKYYIYIVKKTDEGNDMKMAVFYKEKRQFDSAIFYFNKIITADPKDVDAHKAMGNIYLEKQMYDSAEHHLKMAIALNPKAQDAVMDLGVVYFSTNRYPQALTQFNKAVSLDDHYVKAFSNLGRTYFVMGQYNAAIETFHAERNLDPNNINDVSLIALSFKKLGKTDSAKKYEAVAKRSNPGFKL